MSRDNNNKRSCKRPGRLVARWFRCQPQLGAFLPPADPFDASGRAALGIGESLGSKLTQSGAKVALVEKLPGKHAADAANYNNVIYGRCRFLTAAIVGPNPMATGRKAHG